MEAPIDQQQLSDTQRAELFKEGIIKIIDESTYQEINLGLKAGARLFVFMHFHDHIGDLYQEIEIE